MFCLFCASKKKAKKHTQNGGSHAGGGSEAGGSHVAVSNVGCTQAGGGSQPGGGSHAGAHNVGGSQAGGGQQAGGSHACVSNVGGSNTVGSAAGGGSKSVTQTVTQSADKTVTTASVSGGKHVTVGESTMFVPRKIRTTGVKRKVDEIGTQQSVNKN
jgi:hypothetical protein